MTKVVFNKKKMLLCNSMNMKMKRLVKCYVWCTLLYDVKHGLWEGSI